MLKIDQVIRFFYPCADFYIVKPGIAPYLKGEC